MWSEGGGNQQWVLADASGEYQIGDFDGTTFQPRTAMRRMDYGANEAGGTFYAGQTFAGDPRGRVIQTVWQPAARGSIWSGNLTFPAELHLKTYPDGVRLTRTPIDELASLRSGTVTVADRTLTPTTPYTPASADTYEITAQFDTASATASRFGLKLHTRSDGTYDRAVTYDRAAQTLYGAPLAPVNGRVTMRVLVDRGQLEVFGNDGALSVSDVVRFDSAAAGQGIQAYAEGGNVKLVSLRFDRLGSAWGTGESTLTGNLPGGWAAAGGTWTDAAGGKQGNATGDGFYLNSTVTGDGTYEADVRLRDAAAAGLTVRDHYTANVDAAGLVKLWRPGRDIGTYPVPIARDRTYHLEVVATGSRFQVYLDHGSTPVIDAVDTTYATGRTGANVFAGTALVGDITRDATGFATNLAGPWHPAGGTWTAPGDGVYAQGAGDAFYLNSTSGTDFTYQGDVRPVNGIAAALTFRASAYASQHYIDMTAQFGVGVERSDDPNAQHGPGRARATAGGPPPDPGGSCGLHHARTYDRNLILETGSSGVRDVGVDAEPDVARHLGRGRLAAERLRHRGHVGGAVAGRGRLRVQLAQGFQQLGRETGLLGGGDHQLDVLHHAVHGERRVGVAGQYRLALDLRVRRSGGAALDRGQEQARATPRARANCTDCAVPAMIRATPELQTSLTALAGPTVSPTTMVRAPIASKTGPQRSISAGSPEASSSFTASVAAVSNKIEITASAPVTASVTLGAGTAPAQQRSSAVAAVRFQTATS